MTDKIFSMAEQEIHRGLHLVPEHLQEGLQEHCLVGRPVGAFLTACLSNDLLNAVSHGDPTSLAGLKGIVQFLYNYAPPGCWGSKAKVDEWRQRRGLSAELEENLG